ncbi:MAG: low temperature requirement protein A, partial [Allobaculum sp.]|nr:low temperature requirement protein A [Allobaculum sp.]
MQVKEKKVEMIELFYDLIYVYAISKMTKLIETPKNGVIPLFEFFHYFVVCFVILQAWLYLTNYINRYGSWKWYEYGFTMINMVATIYMVNTIQENWEVMAQPFNLSMLVMLLCVVALYLIQIFKKEQDIGAAKNILVNLSIICSLYCLAFIASFFQFSKIIFWMDTIAVLAGAFLPSIIRGNFDIQIISFPHLAERFELITIITFGEGVVD